jgi:hypothetical protein
MDLPDKFVVKTEFGLFQIKISNRDYITIGTGNDCVQIAYSVKKNTATLDWLGTEKGGCEETGKSIHGKDTTSMVDLGLTILRQLYPSVNPTIYLRDSSTFTCILPDGRKYRISNSIYNLLLKGKTYYQDRFNAVPIDGPSKNAVDVYHQTWASTNIPDDFDFKNPEIESILEPLKESSKTWQMFFQAIYEKYGRDSCTIMAPWYLEAYSRIAKQGSIHNSIGSDWYFDLRTRPMIPYEITNVRNKSSTRRNYSYDPYIFGGSIGEHINFRHMNYKKYKYKNTKTRKIRK